MTPALLGQVLMLALLTTLLTMIQVHLSRRSRLVDVPDHRSSHQRITQTSGGISCLVACSTGVIVLLDAQERGQLYAVSVCLLLALAGLLDDLYSLPAIARLGLQLALGGVLGALYAGPEGALLGIFILPASVNIVNFMDGLDGLLPLTTISWGGASIIAGITFDETFFLVSGMLACGTGLGFLPWNFPRAKIFLGDAGSYLYGGIIGVNVIWMSVERPAAFALLTAPLVLHATDVSWTLLRRLKARQGLFAPHKDHSYQLYVSHMRWSHWSVSVGVFTIGSVNVALAFWAPLPAFFFLATSLSIYWCAVSQKSRSVSE